MPASSVDSHESHAWVRAPALWAGLSIITMWLAVLFIGLFGGNILSSSAGGDSTSIPVVVVVLPFVLPATIVAARRGFTAGIVAEPQSVSHEQSQAPAPPATAQLATESPSAAQPATEQPELRAPKAA
jgi:hypothetical protein